MAFKQNTMNRAFIVIPIAIIVAATVLATGTAYGLVMNEKKKMTRETAVRSEGWGATSLSFPAGIDETTAATCLDTWLKKTKPDSELNGKGAAFISAGKKYDVNPSFLLGIAGNESSYGTDYHANANGLANHNYQNMKCPASKRYNAAAECDGDWGKFPSWEESIDRHAQYMQMEYLAKGNTTIEKIGSIYCPLSDRGCDTWVGLVTKITESVVDSCPAFSTTPAGGNGDIVIDPGHGNEDRGFLGPKTEGGNNFDVATRVVNILNSSGQKASLTRGATTDSDGPDLQKRVAYANSANAKLFVSIHSNSNGGTYTFGLVYCPLAEDGDVNFADISCANKQGNGAASTKLAQSLVDSIHNDFGFAPKIAGADPGVLNGLKMPAALIEMFFHDNQASVDKVAGKEQEMAQSIANAIINYLK